MSLREMIHDPGTDMGAIASYLDGLTHDQRMADQNVLNRKDQRALYDKAAGSPPITMQHFLPEDAKPLQPVIHQGRNTLAPLPGMFRFFQKIFTRPQDGSDRAFGYNEGATVKLIGPGYFVTIATAGNTEWEKRGAIVVDYFQVPDGPVPEQWPTVKPNSQGLQMLVYKGTRDYMRRVSEHMSVGAAYKGEKKLDHYFMLCREPLS